MGTFSSLNGTSNDSSRSPQGSSVMEWWGMHISPSALLSLFLCALYFLWNLLACVLMPQDLWLLIKRLGLSSYPKQELCRQSMSLRESLISQNGGISLSSGGCPIYLTTCCHECIYFSGRFFILLRNYLSSPLGIFLVKECPLPCLPSLTTTTLVQNLHLFSAGLIKPVHSPSWFCSHPLPICSTHKCPIHLPHR